MKKPTNLILGPGRSRGELAICSSEKISIALASSAQVRVPTSARRKACARGHWHTAKNLHAASYDQDITVRYMNLFRHFRKGTRSCMDYW